MTVIGCAPTWPIDGPVPQPRPFGIYSVARVIDDVDDAEIERWGNGVAVYPFPDGPAQVWDPFATGSSAVDKTVADPVEIPKFSAYNVILGETCTGPGIFGRGLSNEQAQDRFVNRAATALDAVEAAGVEREFMGGDVLGSQPHLADGNADIVSVAATSVVNAVALLENAIAETGKMGVIHLSPAMVIALTDRSFLRVVDRGTAGVPQLQTYNGTPVIAGAGYVGVSTPDGESTVTGTEEYIYATGPIEVRRSRPIVLPGDLSEALNRGDNSVTYRVERYVVVNWDVQLQSAALVDRCKATC